MLIKPDYTVFLFVSQCFSQLLFATSCNVDCFFFCQCKVGIRLIFTIFFWEWCHHIDLVLSCSKLNLAKLGQKWVKTVQKLNTKVSKLPIFCIFSLISGILIISVHFQRSHLSIFTYFSAFSITFLRVCLYLKLSVIIFQRFL